MRSKCIERSDNGKVSLKTILVIAGIALLAGVLTYLFTSFLKFKSLTKVLIAGFVFLSSLISILANFEGAISLLERIFRIKITSTSGSGHEPQQKRLKILTIIPRPLDAPQLTELSDPENFVETFKKIEAPVDIDFVRPPIFKTFRQRLKKGYDIIHFDGHGSENALLFETEDSLKDEVKAGKFAEEIKSRPPRLIVLSSCLSANGRNSFAEKLHKKLKKTTIIGFTRTVTINEAQKFTGRLYEELGTGKSVEDAVKVSAKEIGDDPQNPKSVKIFRKKSLKFIYVIGRGNVNVDDLKWFKVQRPLQTPIFIGIWTGGKEKRGRLDLIHDTIVEIIYNHTKLALFYGDGGFGKTALAYETARRLAPHFEGGVLWFDGKGKSQIPIDTFLDGTFGSVLGEYFTKQVTDVKRKMAIEYLSEKSVNREPVLIVADNLDFAEKEVWDFLLELPQRCSAIATSREVPQGVPILFKRRVTEFIPEESALMLISMIGGNSINPKIAKEIIELTGGMPAVIEFVATDLRDPEKSFDEILDNLRKYPSKDVSTRFDFTYEPLDDDTKRFLWLLSVIPGHFDELNFVKNLCKLKLSEKDQPPFEKNWEKIWKNLKERRQWIKPLIVENQVNRYEMHPVVKDYIQRKARKADSETFDYFERRFVLIMVGFAEHFRSQLNTEEARKIVRMIELEHDNLIGALKLAKDKEMWNEVLGLTYDLNELFERAGLWFDRWKILQYGLESARKLNKKWDIGAIYSNLGNLASNQGRCYEAKNYFETSLKIFKALGDKAGSAYTLVGLGNLALQQNRYDEAKIYYEKSIKFFEKLKDKTGLANTLISVGSLLFQQGIYNEAKNYWERALEIFEELGNKAGTAKTLHNLAILASEQGRYYEAKNYYEKSLEIFERLGDKAVTASILHNLGILARLQGRYEEAKNFLKKSLKIFEMLGNKTGLADALHNLGNLASQQYRYDEAKNCYEKSLKITVEHEDKAGSAKILIGLGILAQQQERYVEAKNYYEESLKLAKELRDNAGLANALHNLGTLADKLNNPYLAFKFTAIASLMFLIIQHAYTEESVKNLVYFAQKLGYTKEEMESELGKIQNEFQTRGFQFIDELINELSMKTENP